MSDAEKSRTTVHATAADGRPLRAVDQAYEAIRNGILTGRWGSGTHLRENELADITGVSRTPVREALRRLEVDGLITLEPNLGARVNAWEEQDLDEIFGLRRLLECEVVKLAADRITPAQANDLEALCAGMDALVAPFPAVDYRKLTKLDDQFHSMLQEISGHKRLSQVLKQVIELPLVVRTFARYSERSLRRSMGHHRELMEALRAGDGVWASGVMEAHVRAGRAVFREPFMLSADAPLPWGDEALPAVPDDDLSQEL